jgi:hypothetical protein
LLGDLSPFILCLQEIKLQACDAPLCLSLWGNSPHEFSYRPSAGASGGLLTLWDSFEVEVWSSESPNHVLWCHGRFVTFGEEFSVANVYAPCESGAKQVLLERSLWEGVGCAYAAISMRLNMWMNAAPPGRDCGHWITSL